MSLEDGATAALPEPVPPTKPRKKKRTTHDTSTESTKKTTRGSHHSGSRQNSNASLSSPGNHSEEDEEETDEITPLERQEMLNHHYVAPEFTVLNHNGVGASTLSVMLDDDTCMASTVAPSVATAKVNNSSANVQTKQTKRLDKMLTKHHRHTRNTNTSSSSGRQQYQRNQHTMMDEQDEEPSQEEFLNVVNDVDAALFATMEGDGSPRRTTTTNSKRPSNNHQQHDEFEFSLFNDVPEQSQPKEFALNGSSIPAASSKRHHRKPLGAPMVMFDC